MPALSISRPYWVLGTMVTESMIGGLTGLLSSPVAVVLDRNAGDRLADVVARDQLADDGVLIVEPAVGAAVMKNWQSLVSGPLLAKASRPEDVNRRSALNSSSWTCPGAPLGPLPPLPVPNGSPP